MEAVLAAKPADQTTGADGRRDDRWNFPPRSHVRTLALQCRPPCQPKQIFLTFAPPPADGEAGAYEADAIWKFNSYSFR